MLLKVRLRGFYPLALFDQFGEINIDKYPARYEGINNIGKWVNITLNKKPWIPSAKVLQPLPFYVLMFIRQII